MTKDMVLITMQKHDGTFPSWEMPIEVYTDWSHFHQRQKGTDGKYYWVDTNGQPYIVQNYTDMDLQDESVQDEFLAEVEEFLSAPTIVKCRVLIDKINTYALISEENKDD